MRIVRAEELDTFLKSQNRSKSLAFLKNELVELNEFCCQFQMPTSFAKILAVAKIAMSLLKFDEWALLVVEERGIWPNFEDLHTFNALMMDAGIKSDVSSGDALMFSKSDSHRIFSYFQLLCNFRWSIRLIVDQRSWHFHVTHDDNAIFYSESMTSEISKGLELAASDVPG